VAFEQSGSADPEKLVVHWVGAGEKARAAGYAVRAANEAAASLAFDHAASLYRLALDLGPASTEEVTALRVKLAEALANAGRGARAAAAYIEAAGRSNANSAIDLRRRAAEALFGVGHIEDGTQTIGSVLRAVGVAWSARPVAVLLSLLFYSLVLALRGLKFEPRGELEIDPRALLRVDCLASAGTVGMTDHVRGKLFHVRTLVEALRVGEPIRIGRALAMYAASYATAGAKAFERTMELREQVARMGVERRDPMLRGYAEVLAGYAYFLSGRPFESCASFERGEVILRDQCVGVTYPLASARTLFYRALVHSGELSAASERVEVTLAQAEQRGDRYSVANYRATVTAFLALAHDDAAACQRELEIASRHLAMEAFHLQHCFCLVGRALLAIYRGAPVDAHAEILARWPALKRSLLLRVQTLRIALHDVHARACVAAFAAEGERGAREKGITRKTIAREIRALEREGTAWADANAQLARAGFLAVTGDRAAALREGEDAEQRFDGLHMPLVAAAARRQRGVLLRGREGDLLVGEGEERLRSHGVVNPPRFAALLAPGFERG
jgi:hypothetical protein